MGLFNKKKKENSYMNTIPKLPTLPELPGHSEFPEIPTLKQTPGELLNLKNDDDIHKLPSFPSTSLGEKISQDTIKSAVGFPNNENTYKDYEYDDNEVNEKMPEMIPEKVRSPNLNSLPQLNTSKIKSRVENETNIIPKAKSIEPIFIRIDKFEESLKVFQIVKEKISEIEELLKDTKDVKKREDEELDRWENEILQLKMQIEKVNKDIFSKIE